jgi:hypothetical protein
MSRNDDLTEGEALAQEAARLAVSFAGASTGKQILQQAELKVLRQLVQELLDHRGGVPGDVLYWRCVVEELKK